MAAKTVKKYSKTRGIGAGGLAEPFPALRRGREKGVVLCGSGIPAATIPGQSRQGCRSHSRTNGALLPPVYPFTKPSAHRERGTRISQNLRPQCSIVILCAFLVLLARPGWSEPSTEQIISKAQDLLEQKKPLKAIKILEAEDSSAHTVLLQWKAESLIGKLADPASRSPENDRHKYFQHIQQNEDRFRYYEPDGAFHLSETRIQELRQKMARRDDSDRYLDDYEWGIIKHDFQAAAEGGHFSINEDKLDSLIQRTTNLISTYPDSNIRSEARQLLARLDRIRESKK